MRNRIVTVDAAERLTVSLSSSSPTLDSFPALTARHPVLVSDDELSAIILIKLILEQKLNLTVLGAESPQDTLRLCELIPFSLVISDINKPGMNGLEMLEHLNANRAPWTIPLMFLSACNRSTIAQQAVERGAVTYLSKPILPKDLAANVQQILIERGNWEPGSYDFARNAPNLGDSRLVRYRHDAAPLEVYQSAEWVGRVITPARLAAATPP